MNYKEIVTKICVALGIEVKLEQMKLNDGVTVIEADSFEAGNDIMIITEDEQKIPMPVGKYVAENGKMIVVIEEGVIAEVKEQDEVKETEAINEDKERMKKEEDEKMKKEDYEKIKKDEMKEEKMIDRGSVKKTVESMVKETFFSEMETLKVENEKLKTQLAQMQEPKAIVHNPESTEKVQVIQPKTTRDLVMNFINK